MAIVLKALVLCATDNPQEAMEALYETLNSCSFTSDNPIVDFAVGIEQVVEIQAPYDDGTFLKLVPGHELLQTANSIQMPI